MSMGISMPFPQCCSQRIKPKLKTQRPEEVSCGGVHHISAKFTCLASARNKQWREKMDEGNAYRQRANQGHPGPRAPGVWHRLARGALLSMPSSRPSLPCLRTTLLSAGKMAAPDNAPVLFPGVCEHTVLHSTGQKRLEAELGPLSADLKTGSQPGSSEKVQEKTQKSWDFGRGC